MLQALVLAAAIVGSPPVAAPDTVLALQPGDRIVFENLSGEISVSVWERSELELRGTDAAVALQVRRSGSTVRVFQEDGKGRRRVVEAAFNVPAWVDIEIGGPYLDVWVDGLDGRLDVRNVEGDITVRNTTGVVNVRTVEGEIDIEGARSAITASSQAYDVRLRDVSGPVAAYSGSGNIFMVDVRSGVVLAETQNGNIDFSGTIASDGDYRFSVHDGDAIIAVPPGTNAQVSVSTFDGEFESEFPVVINRFTGGRAFDFELGEGGASIQIQVFDGEIRLLQRH